MKLQSSVLKQPYDTRLKEESVIFEKLISAQIQQQKEKRAAAEFTLHKQREELEAQHLAQEMFSAIYNYYSRGCSSKPACGQ